MFQQKNSDKKNTPGIQKRTGESKKEDEKKLPKHNEHTLSPKDTPQERISEQLSNTIDNSPQSRITAQLKSPVVQRMEEEEEKEVVQGKFGTNHQSGVVQRQANNTGMPDNLKSGIESLSGMAMDDVKVHYNSDKPAQLNALAYAQGTDIHLSPGQEQHLPHEAWHVVQQKQGRVAPTTQMKGIGVNDNQVLEKEADVMGARALNTNDVSQRLPSKARAEETAQLMGQQSNVAQLKKWAGSDEKTVAQTIFEDYAIDRPRIVFRYDSRPIEVALSQGYVAQDPENANITEGGENQSLVGGALNYVGSMNYKGFARSNLDDRTKSKWKNQGYQAFFWTAAIIREGGYTFKWILDKIPDENVKLQVEQLILERKEGSKETDKKLKELVAKYTKDDKNRIGGINNVGTTELVTSQIRKEDILGYFEFRDYKDGSGLLPEEYTVNKEIEEIDGHEQIPEEDLVRYKNFIATGGEMKMSHFM